MSITLDSIACTMLDATDPDRRVRDLPKIKRDEDEDPPPRVKQETASVVRILDRNHKAKPHALTGRAGAGISLSTLALVVQAVIDGANREPLVRAAIAERGIKTSHTTCDRYLRILDAWGVIVRKPRFRVFVYTAKPGALARLERKHAEVAA